MQVFTVTDQHNSLMATIVNDDTNRYIATIGLQLDTACGISGDEFGQMDYIIKTLSDNNAVMIDLWQNGIPIWIYVLNV
jgi:hypothetical protein